MAAGAAVVGLPTEAGARSKSDKLKLAEKVGSPLSVHLEVLPYGNPPLFAASFQGRMEGWDEFWEGHFRPVGELHLAFREVRQSLSKGGYAGANPWLDRPEAPPHLKTLEVDHFREYGYGLIDTLVDHWALFYHCHYWKVIREPYQQWKAEQLKRLDHVMVRFEAELVR
ncbi:hypothetical protein LCGC14_2962530 [marine sediment metagenome]|uniref:Uncharacterized protein n=1 Tax=marine sediment metagenome TaxID=412755 RepID=A0A0F8ZJK6_9ZZZZ